MHKTESASFLAKGECCFHMVNFSCELLALVLFSFGKYFSAKLKGGYANNLFEGNLVFLLKASNAVLVWLIKYLWLSALLDWLLKKVSISSLMRSSTLKNYFCRLNNLCFDCFWNVWLLLLLLLILSDSSPLASKSEIHHLIYLPSQLCWIFRL